MTASALALVHAADSVDVAGGVPPLRAEADETSAPTADTDAATDRGASAGIGRRLALVSHDAGMTTAEYAIGTVAACGFGGVLIKLLTSDTVVSLLSDLIRKALTLAF
ncbi:MAG: DUF4244 domain-containing protein [Actinomycetes bacterium]